MLLLEIVGVDGGGLWRAGCRPLLILNGCILGGRERIEWRGGCVDGFFVGVCDDEVSAGRTLASSTGGQWL